mgnify:FL=1
MKSIYKYMFSIPIGCMLLGFQSCSDDKTEGESNPQPVILKAEVYTAGNETGTVWNSGQSLGVYMLKNGTREIAGEHANLKFLADNRGSTGYLVPADNVPVYYPEDGTKVDFRVYYPYDEKIKTRSQDLHQTEVVITDKTQADALLYSDNSQGNDGSGRPTVQLRSMLSAVKLDMHCDMKEAATITATIRNTAIRAVFDVIEGKFVKRPLEEGSSLQLTATRKTSTSGDIFTLQATLLSGVMEEGAEIEIEVKDKAGKVIKSYQPAKLRKVLDLGKDNVAEENTQYEIDGQLNAGSENITTQMAAKTQIVILKWNGNDDSAIGGIARPERKQK